MAYNYLREAFKDMDSINEDVFNMSDDGAQKLQAFLDGDTDSGTVAVIDPQAKTEDDLEDSYVGKVILDCCVCHSLLYKDKADIILDDEDEFANVGTIPRFEELLAAFIEKPQGKPTLVPESDKRPAVNNARTDFSDNQGD